MVPAGFWHLTVGDLLNWEYFCKDTLLMTIHRPYSEILTFVVYIVWSQWIGEIATSPNNSADSKPKQWLPAGFWRLTVGDLLTWEYFCKDTLLMSIHRPYSEILTFVVYIVWSQWIGEIATSPNNSADSKPKQWLPAGFWRLIVGDLLTLDYFL